METLVEKPPETLTLETPTMESASRVSQESENETLVEEPVPLDPTEEHHHHTFSPGDFVWGKLRSRLWWPGRICDPSSSPETGRAHRRNPGSLFVAYFGGEPSAWCPRAQLKPFKQEFSHMVAQSASGSFLGAVESALQEIGRCLEFDLACDCVEFGDSDVVMKLEKQRVPFTSYAPLEFLELVCDAARDALVVDMLEITMLRSWAVAFSRGGGQRRCAIIDLLDKIDLDDPPGESVTEDDGGRVSWIDEDFRKPEIAEEKYQSRKKRSMAKLIAEMDLNAVEVSDGDEEEEEEEADEEKEDVVPIEEKPEEEKEEEEEEEEEEMEKEENAKDPELVSNSAGAEEGTGLGKRERKKSKYLSYPYTHLSAHGKQLVLPEDPELKTPKKSSDTSWALHPGSPTLSRCNSDALGKEDDQKSIVTKLDGTSAKEIVSEFLAMAVDCVHLKWNRSAKMIRGFFALYRSSLYSDGSEYQAYQKHLGECCCMTGKSLDGVLSKEGKSDGGAKKRKGGPSGETFPDLDQIARDGSQQGKSASGSKSTRDEADGESHQEQSHAGTALDEEPETMEGSEKVKTSRGKKTKKNGANEGTPLNLSHAIEGNSAPSLTRLKRQMRIDGANGRGPINVAVEIVSSIEQGKSGTRKRKGKNGSDGQRIIDFSAGVMSYPEAGKLAQETNETELLTNGNNLPDADQAPAERPKSGKSGRKRRKGIEGCNIENSLGSGQQINDGSEDCKAEKEQKTEKKKDKNNSESPAALLLSFAPGVTLPSKDDLINAFRKYGNLNEADTEVLKDSSCARVVFTSSSDAEKALNSHDKTGTFAPPNASYRVRYLPGNPSPQQSSLPVPKPLPYIRKNLEMMISTLAGSSVQEKDAGPSDGLRTDAKENLVGEMQGLLEKVNKLLGGPPPPAGTSS